MGFPLKRCILGATFRKYKFQKNSNLYCSLSILTLHQAAYIGSLFTHWVNAFTSRCTCDDCSLSHILTCGIMDAPMAEDLHLKLPMQTEPPRNYLSEVHPPSMSSGSSGSGSAPGSPITIQQHPRLILPQDGTTTLWVKTVLCFLFNMK